MTTPIVTAIDNGLRVLLLENRAAPVATFWIWYGVGSRHEAPGGTGISHWVEHMQFKGTPTHPRATLTRAIERLGGRWNAFTSWDYTAYHEVLPAEHLPFVIDLEADRMRHTTFDPGEVESERTVIIAEREGAENHPTSYLQEEVSALAFKVHPYRYPVIGWKGDLQRITRDDLYRHYRTFYHPHNALAVAVGAFEPPRALEDIRRAFGEVAPGPAIPPVRLEEPPQEGERRVVVQRAGGATSYLQLAFRAPAATDADFAAVMVLDGILSGLGARGNGGAARSSRLYRALIDRGLAVEASSSFFPTRDPGLLRIGATVRTGVPVAGVEEAVLEQLRLLAGEDVPPDELARVKRQAKAQFVYARDGVHGFGYAIGLYAMTDQPEGFFTLPDRLERVGAADVQRVAAAVFAPERRTVGWYLPREGAPATGTAAGAPSPHHVYRQPESSTMTAPVVGPEEIQRKVLPNGLRVLAVDRPGSGMVALHAWILAGSAFDGGRPGLARFVAAAQPRGTAVYNARDLAERLDGLGASLGIFPGTEVMVVAGRTLADDVAAYLALVGEVLVRPTFPPDEVEKVRGEVLTALRVSGVDTRYVAERAFRRLAFPAGHPHAQPPAGEEEAIQAVNPAALAAFHRRYISPERTILVLVGDLRPAAAAEAVERALGGWGRGPVAAEASLPGGVPGDGARVEEMRREAVALPGKSQADIVLGGAAVARQDPAYYQVALANYILGGQGMMGRVGERVREQMGLAYYAYLEARAGLLAGPWWARAGVNPANVERAVEAVLEEIARFQRDGPGAAEVADARDFLTGSLAVRLETHGGLAGSLAEIELYGLGLDYLVRYPALIRAVTPEEMRAAAQRFPTERYVLAIAGPEPR